MEPADRPGRFGYYAAAVFAVAGIAACVVLVMNFIENFDGGSRFVAPGAHAFTVEKPGKQVIWNDYRTVFAGRSFDVPERLPDGLHIKVTEAASGKFLDIAPDRGASSKTTEAQRVSIASFEAAAPGRYTITIEGDFPPRVFSVAPSFMLQLFGTILAAIGVLAVGFAAALGLAIWTFLRRNASAPAAPSSATGAPSPQTSPVVAVTTSPDESARQIANAVYALQAVSFLVVISMIAGVILDYVKREDVAGTWLESHFTWQIRTFWWWLVWMAVAAVLAIIFIGIFVALANQIWLLYRIIKGWIRLSEGKPMYSNS